jgi:dipeptidyl aminopeptidase/acylaminoacyl peptidase
MSSSSPSPAGIRRRFGCAILLLAMVGVARAEDRAPPPGEAVLNAHVVLHWMEGGTRAWYRRQTSPEHWEFVLVDALAGTHTPLFDHVRLASELQKALGRPIAATDLPLRWVGFLDEGRTLQVAAGGKWLEGPFADPVLGPSTRRPLSIVSRDPLPGHRAGGATTLTIANRSGRTIELFWMKSPDEPVSYGLLAAGEERTLDTYTGHVWQAMTMSGTRSLGTVEAGVDSAYAEITGRFPDRPAPKSPDPDISPDGNWQVFQRADNLWLKRLGLGGVDARLAVQDTDHALTTDGTPADAYRLPVVWSPDSTHLVALRFTAGSHRTITLVDSAPDFQVQSRAREIPYPKPGDRIDSARPCLFSVADRRQIAVDGTLLLNPWSIDQLAWNPDGQAFTLLFNQRGHQAMRVLEVDRAGHARALVDERSPTFIDYVGKSFCRRLDARREILWMSERDGWNHLYLYDAVTGQVKNQVTRGAWAVRTVERVDEAAGQIWFTAGGLVPGEDPYQRHLARVTFDGSGLTVLTAGDGDHEVAWSPDRRWFVDTWSRVDAPPQSVLRDGATGRQVIALEQAEITGLRALGWQSPERFAAKARDGVTDVYGVLWRPRGFAADRHYPVVECIYAGPQAAYVPKSFKVTYGQQAIADLGFVVGMVDCMGTSYRSKAFHDVCWKNLADAGFPDRIPWWKAAAATRPWLDLSRVGIYGGSAGGQNALGALLWHPEFYQVAVADCGCHDNRVDKLWWNELWMGWPVGPHYAQQSNVVNAARLQGRLMLIVGEVDDNVDPACTYQVAHALEQAGKDFELVVVQGAGHGAAETPFGSRKRADFLVRELLGPKR